MLWLLVTGSKGGFKFHSAHTDQATAKAWEKCKEYEGEDCEIVELNADAVVDLGSVLDKVRDGKKNP